jgi:hypothetical protein
VGDVRLHAECSGLLSSCSIFDPSWRSSLWLYFQRCFGTTEPGRDALRFERDTMIPPFDYLEHRRAWYVTKAPAYIIYMSHNGSAVR